MVFLGTSWSAIQNPTSAASCFKTLNMPVTFSVPMLPASGANIATGATGAYDAYWEDARQEPGHVLDRPTPTSGSAGR